MSFPSQPPQWDLVFLLRLRAMKNRWIVQTQIIKINIRKSEFHFPPYTQSNNRFFWPCWVAITLLVCADFLFEGKCYSSKNYVYLHENSTYQLMPPLSTEDSRISHFSFYVIKFWSFTPSFLNLDCKILVWRFDFSYCLLEIVKWVWASHSWIDSNYLRKLFFDDELIGSHSTPWSQRGARDAIFPTKSLRKHCLS